MANLVILARWTHLVPGSASYFGESRLPAGAALAVALVALAFALAIFVVLRAARRFVAPRAPWALPLAAALALAFLARRAWAEFAPPTLPTLVTPAVLVVLAALLVACVVALARGRSREVGALLAAVLLSASPLLAVSAWNATAALREPAAPAAEVLAPAALGVPAAHRVVWIVFDEMDYNLSFERRPASLALPAFDRLRDESLFATQAYSPTDFTLTSIPSMTTGRFVPTATPAGPGDLELRFADGTSASWSATPNLFSQAAQMGVSSAIAGWYHPYCRLFGTLTESCLWRQSYVLPDPQASFGDDLVAQARGLAPQASDVAGLPLAGVGAMDAALARNEQANGVRAYEDVLAVAEADVARPDLGLVYIHFDVPHLVGGLDDAVGIYRRDTGILGPDPRSDYLDNLALADATLAKLRDDMERAGTWNATALLVTADHGYRPTLWGAPPVSREDAALLSGPADRRVPFLLKPADGGANATFAAPFNTVLIHDLLLAQLRGELHGAAGVAAWLQQHRGVGPSPYYALPEAPGD